MDDLLTIMSLVVAGISGVAGIIWSTHYREAKKAEMAAKDAGYQAKESGYKSQLETKEASIKFLELITEPKYVDKVKKTIGEQKSNIKKLQDTIEQLKNQLTEADNQNEALKKEIANLSISDSERNNLALFTTGSTEVINRIKGTSDNLLIVENDIESGLTKLDILSRTEPEYVVELEKYLRIIGGKSDDDDSPSDVEET